MAKVNHAYVTSHGRLGGYCIRMSADAYAAFEDISAVRFTTYRAAQDVANAIKAHVAKKAAK